MNIIHAPNDMRVWSVEQRRAGFIIGFVPTMGALHEGHASLMRAAVAECDVAVLSIFVNPTQFGPAEDLEKYPRTLEADCALAERIGIHAVYAPSARAMYPDGYATYVNVERLTEGLCGRSRPWHFRGVTSVVAKLFNAVLPDRAYFGQKDAQQYAVIRRMTADLDLGIEIMEMPIVREPDGLAMSSRNRYLNPEERKQALALSTGLFAAQEHLRQGERDVEHIKSAVRDALAAVAIDYVELVDAETLTPLEAVQGTVLLAVAARVGGVRLIDNIKYEVPKS